jgi:hypothetical protein
MNLPTLDPRAWRTLWGAVAAVCSYALATNLHPDVVLAPVASFVLGGVLVALAVINPPGGNP